MLYGKKATIFYVYDNYNNMRNMPLKQLKEYIKMIICILGSILMDCYFYVKLKIKQNSIQKFLKINSLLCLCFLRFGKSKRRIQYFTMSMINSSSQVPKYGIYLQVNYNRKLDIFL